MTGTTDLSADQLKSITDIVKRYEARHYTVCHVVISPRTHGESVTVKLVTLNEGYEGPLESSRVVYRSGAVATVADAEAAEADRLLHHPCADCPGCSEPSCGCTSCQGLCTGARG